MPYFIKIGVFAKLKGKLGSRGWHIWRRRNFVQWKFGPVEIINARSKHVRWAAVPTMDRPKQFRSDEEAASYMQKKMLEKERGDGDGSYQRLPRGKRILNKNQRT
jgi:hypothetical protein